MTDEQRSRIFEALMADIPPGDATYPILAEIVAEDVNRIEPVIDEILRAERRKVYS